MQHLLLISVLALTLQKPLDQNINCGACRLLKEGGHSFKWLLYGDDDTYFSTHAALQSLQHLDPEMPYFITGRLSQGVLRLLRRTLWTQAGSVICRSEQ